MSSISSDLLYSLQLDPETAEALTRFARRRRGLLTLRAIAVGIVCFVAIMLSVAICDYVWLLSDGARWLLSLCGYAATFAAMWWSGLRHFGVQDPRQIARQLESAAPRLREDLLSAVELADPKSANGSEGFRKRLQRSVARRAALLDFSRLLPVGLVQRWLFSGVLVTLTCLVMLMVPKMQFGRRIARAMLPGVPIQRASLTELTILKPSPPSGFVAEGDAVGVVVSVSGVAADDVMMHWRTEEGIEGESVMSPRVQPQDSNSTGTLQHDNTFAANLSVGTTPIEYRIIAGDAITLWHELTPLPRPRVASFIKRYEFPSYAKLADRVEEAEHGDLTAIVGTLAEVTVRFDEGVKDATLRFGNRGVTFSLDAVDGSDREYVVSIPIKTPATYQIDATSARSGLNNPFSPQYSITPVIDTAPSVHWAKSLPKTLIVSPLDVVALGASAIDDLPMERVVQEFQINGQAVERREIPVPEPGRELQLQWDWDLLRRIDGEESSIKLAGGDIIRTRVVGVDRRSKRGESAFIELLVAEEGFDSGRHNRLDELSEVTSELADWATRAREWMEHMKDVALQDQVDELAAAKETAKELHDEKEAIASRIQSAVQTSSNLPEASTLELCGRALLDFDQKLGAWFSQLEFVSAEEHEAWKKTREKALRDLSAEASRHAKSASRIEQYARVVFGEELTVGIVGDAMSLSRSLRPLLDQEEKLPMNRFPRYLKVAIGRMEAISDLIEKHTESLPESTQRHLQNWLRWADSWRGRLQDSIERPPKEQAHRSLVTSFDTELRNQFDHAMVDGRLASTVTNLLRELRTQVGATSDLHRQMATHGENAIKSRSRAESEQNSDDVARLGRDAEYADVGFKRWRSLLLNRLDREETLHRSRPNVDLQYAADMKLMRRAIENVTEAGYVSYQDEAAASVHQNLSEAFRVIEGKHEADMWLGELRALMLAERRLSATAVEKVKHPTWVERFTAGLEWPVRTLRSAKIDRQLTDRLERTRYSDDFNKAKLRITSRRWSGDEMLTAELQLDSLQQELADALVPLEPNVVEARQTIQRYVLTLSEQARQAAEKAREAKERTDTRADSEPETAEQLADKQQEAEQATRATLESLVDLANTAEVRDAEQRELARDADAAAAQIQSAAERAENAMDEATAATNEEERSESLDETAKALEDLAISLEQTAEHFERAENGEDLAESREQLRQAEEALRLQDEMQEQYDREEAMAGAAESSPEELMERLERELQQNEPMQQELSEIAERAAEAAQRTLEKAAQDEAALNQSLERSDSSFQERKRRVATELENLARRASAVDRSLLTAAERAVGWANAPETRPKLDEARRELRDAVQKSSQMGGERALLSEMRETAAEMSRSIDEATQAMKEIAAQAEQTQSEDIHKDKPSRDRAKSQLQKFATDARSEQLRAATSEKQQWDRAERDAGRRAQQAQRQKRDAENRKKQTQQRIKREPKNAEALHRQLAEYQRRVDEAQRNEQAAKETQDFADQKGKDVDQRSKQLKSKKFKSLDLPNPAAQLALQMSEQANDELDQIQRDLRALADETDFGDDLRVPQAQAQQLANQQQSIEQDVKDASEQLRRAARHEQRLGQQELAQQLDAAADAVAANAASAAEAAGESLQQVTANAEQSPEADRQVTEATMQISEAARQLAEMLTATSPSSGDEASQQTEPSAAEKRGQQLAQTLDELDRAMSQPPGQTQEGEGGQPQPGETAEQSDQQPSDPTAADASPTLAGAMDAQAQQAAKKRQEQMNPGSPGQQSGPPSDQTASSKDSETEGGTGQMPSGGFVDTMGVDRFGSDWGQLRELRSDDASESRRATVAPQYRREIEAYFRAIARRAAERSE